MRGARTGLDSTPAAPQKGGGGGSFGVQNEEGLRLRKGGL